MILHNKRIKIQIHDFMNGFYMYLVSQNMPCFRYTIRKTLGQHAKVLYIVSQKLEISGSISSWRALLARVRGRSLSFSVFLLFIETT